MKRLSLSQLEAKTLELKKKFENNEPMTELEHSTLWICEGEMWSRGWKWLTIDRSKRTINDRV